MADAAENAKPEAAPGTMHVRTDNGIGWMIYDQQAKYNAVTYDMRRAIPGIMADFESDDDVRVAVIAGAGDKAFISGSDISQFGEKRSSEEARRMYDEASEQANLAMRSFSKPMIAMIHGYCLGAGVLTAMLCDFRIAADNAQFGAPPAKLGLGFGYGGVMTTILVCVRVLVPLSRGASALGIVSMFALIGHAVGGYQGGVFFDLTGDYTQTYLNAAFAGVINLIIVGSGDGVVSAHDWVSSPS